MTKKIGKVIKGLLMIGMGVTMNWVWVSVRLSDPYAETGYFKTIFMVALVVIGILELQEAFYE